MSPANRLLAAVCLAGVLAPVAHGRIEGLVVRPGKGDATLILRVYRVDDVMAGVVGDPDPVDYVVNLVKDLMPKDRKTPNDRKCSVVLEPATMQLLVVAPDCVHQRIDAATAVVRRLPREVIELDACVFTSAAGFLSACPECKEIADGGSFVALDEARTARLLKAVRKDNRACVSSRSKIAVDNGHTGSLSVAKEVVYPTDLKMIRTSDGLKFEQRTGSMSVGLQLAVRPVVAAGGNEVSLTVDSNFTTLLNPSLDRRLPAAFDVKPDAAIGESLISVRLEQPTFDSQAAVYRAVEVATGSSALFKIGRRPNAYRSAPGRLIENTECFSQRLATSYVADAEEVFVLVTPRVVDRKVDRP